MILVGQLFTLRIIYLPTKILQQYSKNMKIIKVKRDICTFFLVHLYIFSYKTFVKLTLNTYVVYTIVIIQSWFCPRTLAHLQWEKILNPFQKNKGKILRKFRKNYEIPKKIRRIVEKIFRIFCIKFWESL